MHCFLVCSGSQSPDFICNLGSHPLPYRNISVCLYTFDTPGRPQLLSVAHEVVCTAVGRWFLSRTFRIGNSAALGSSSAAGVIVSNGVLLFQMNCSQSFFKSRISVSKMTDSFEGKNKAFGAWHKQHTFILENVGDRGTYKEENRSPITR